MRTCSLYAPRVTRLCLLLGLLLGSSGCITTAGVWKRDTGVALPLLLGATAADLALSAGVASTVTDFTVGATIGTALAITAADLAVGCLVGSCSSLGI